MSRLSVAGEGLASEGLASEGLASEGLASEGLAGALLAGVVVWPGFALPCWCPAVVSGAGVGHVLGARVGGVG